MRDFLSYDPATTVPGYLPDRPADPVARAREHARADLPKRFYTEAAAGPAEAEAGPGWRVRLDGRPVKTPAGRPLILPSRVLAEAVAAEWNAQGERIDPRSMPHTRLANSVIDGVADRQAEVAADAAGYAGSDLLCYRAATPERLVERQTALWDPILDWVEERFGARFLVAEGVMHVAQDSDALAAISAAIAPLDPWRLAGLHSLTTLSGSVLIALAHLHDRLDVDAAWQAATLDEAWSLEIWGRDEEAVARLEARRREFDTASLFARPAGPA